MMPDCQDDWNALISLDDPNSVLHTIGVYNYRNNNIVCLNVHVHACMCVCVCVCVCVCE